MRKFLAFVLLAGVAAPALAAGDPGDRWRSHGDSGQQSSQNESDNRSDRGERPHFNRGSDNNNSGGNVEQHQVRQQVQVEQSNGGGGGQDNGRYGGAQFGGGGMSGMRHSDGDNRGRFDGGEQTQVQVQGEGARVRGDHRGRFDGGEQPQVQVQPRDTTDSVRNWHGPRVITPTQTDNGSLREQRRDIPGVFRNRVPIVSSTPREGTQPPLRLERRHTDSVLHSDWRNRWRNDHRYDWRDHRRHHRSIFHLGLYFDPFGWSYQPYQIGWRLWPSYYSSRYWINDPWQYRLPYAPPGYVWIRYWDDAILVDTWSGEVVDVIPNFFW